ISSPARDVAFTYQSSISRLVCKHRCQTDELRAAGQIGAILPPPLGSRTHMTDLDQTPSDGMSAAGSRPADLAEHSRTGMSAHALQRALTDHLRYTIGRPAAALRPEHCYRALALAVRDRMQDRRVASTQTSLDLGRKVTCYLSAEFLMGPQLGNNLLNLG